MESKLNQKEKSIWETLAENRFSTAPTHARFTRMCGKFRYFASWAEVHEFSEPLIARASNLPEAVHLTRHAVRLGCRAVMVLPPCYYKDPAPEGLFRHYAELVERVADDRLRIVLYHIPQVSGVGLPIDLVARLRLEFPDTVVGIKDSSGDWSNTQRLFGIDGLTVYPGAELQLIDALDLGGPGCITATANVNAGPVAEVIRLYTAGDREAAVSAHEGVVAYRLLLQDYAAIPSLKRLLAQWHDDPVWANVRPPFLPMDEGDGRSLSERLAAS